MSNDEFLKTLASCKYWFTWTNDPIDGIIGRDKGRKFDCVTAIYYYSTNGTAYCPLWKSRQIRRKLDMSEELRTTIIRASVNFCVTPKDRIMRTKLLEVLFNESGR